MSYEADLIQQFNDILSTGNFVELLELSKEHNKLMFGMYEGIILYSLINERMKDASTDMIIHYTNLKDFINSFYVYPLSDIYTNPVIMAIIACRSKFKDRFREDDLGHEFDEIFIGAFNTIFESLLEYSDMPNSLRLELKAFKDTYFSLPYDEEYV